MICGSVAVATNSEVRISRIRTLVCTTANQPPFPMGHLLRQVDLQKECVLRLTANTFVGWLPFVADEPSNDFPEVSPRIHKSVFDVDAVESSCFELVFGESEQHLKFLRVVEFVGDELNMLYR